MNHLTVEQIFSRTVMEQILLKVNIDESYELGLSSSEYYDLERIQLQSFIRKLGNEYYIMGRSRDGGVLEKGIELFGLFLLTENLEIARLERCSLA
jgi:hypothetical protein